MTDGTGQCKHGNFHETCAKCEDEYERIAEARTKGLIESMQRKKEEWLKMLETLREKNNAD
jgi:hypothetical protein